MKNSRPTISESLRAAITSSGMTSYKLGKLSGLSPIAIDRFMLGERGLSIDSVDKLASVLGLELTKKSRAIAKKKQA